MFLSFSFNQRGAKTNSHLETYKPNTQTECNCPMLSAVHHLPPHTPALFSLCIPSLQQHAGTDVKMYYFASLAPMFCIYCKSTCVCVCVRSSFGNKNNSSEWRRGGLVKISRNISGVLRLPDSQILAFLSVTVTVQGRSRRGRTHWPFVPPPCVRPLGGPPCSPGVASALRFGWPALE